MPATGPYGRVVVSCTIALNGTLSGVVDLSPGALACVRFPNLWDAANISFASGTDADDMGDVYDGSGNLYVLTGGPGRWVPIENPNIFVGRGLLQIRSGTPSALVTQTAARVFKLIAQRLYTG